MLQWWTCCNGLQWQRGCCNGGRTVLQRQTDFVATTDAMLQDAGGRSVATLTGERTTVNGATPKYGSYR